MPARSLIVLTACAVALLVLPPAQGGPEQDGRVPNGVEVLPRGPVHEAYAMPADAAPQPGPVVPRQPPQAIEEQPPDQKPDGAVWVPGYWQWDEERSDFIWISGFWRMPPPGRQWVPGGYRQTDKGIQWSPGMWLSQNQQQLTVVPPPPVSVENGPSQPQPADNSQYIPGSWMYNQDRYLWRPGYWTGYRPDLVWFPAQYYWTPNGYVFVDGYWDYPLANRGLLFAPVAFGGGVWNQPGFAYTPSYVVSVNFLPTALFVRPGWGHYYFGDYFGGGFARAGYTPWVNYSYRPRVSDPLFVHAQVGNGAGWGRNLTTLYANRVSGQGVLPPRTLAQQNTLITSTRTNVNSVRVLSPLNQAAAEHGLRMTSLNQAERRQVRTQSQNTPIRAGKGTAPVQTPVNSGHGLNTLQGTGRPGGNHVAPSYHAPAVVPHQTVHPVQHGTVPTHSAQPVHSAPAHHSSGGHHSSGHGHR